MAGEQSATTDNTSKEKVVKKAPDREYYSVKDIALKLNLTTAWISQLCKDGRLKAIKIGKVWRIPKIEWEKIQNEGLAMLLREPPTSPVIELPVKAGPQDKVAPKIPEEKAEEVKKPVGFPRFWR